MSPVDVSDTKGASPLVDLLGSSLLGSSGEVSTSEALAGKKAIGLYFSAHWCPPCRGFTPMLGTAYTENLKAKGLEIVFVSSDKTPDEFKGYFGEMPWLALPYEARELKAKLSKKYKVSGIPSFVILDGATGELITTNGREAVQEDPKGNELPWRPPSIWDCLGSEFLNSEGDTVEIEELRGEGRVIGLYFSAHWCPPCRSFTPALVKAYEAHLKAKQLEVIFVSSDKDAKSFQEYFATMPWLAIPNGDARKGKLSKYFEVEGIPTFVLLDAATGETITTKARANVSIDPEGAEFPWFPKPLSDMVAEGPGDINDTLTLCVLMEGCEPAVVDAAKKALEPLAKAAKDKKEEICFLYASTVGGPTEQIRKLTKVGSPIATPQMVLMDIPDNGGFYVSPATEVTADTVTGFLEAYKAGGLQRLQLG